MAETTERFDWHRIPDEVSRRAHELWTASLGLVATVEEQGEHLLESVRRDRGAIVEDLQHRSTKALDDLQAQANRIFDDLVARGEKLQVDSRRFVEEKTRDLAARPREIAEDVEHAVEKTVASVLHRMDVPSRVELKRLSDRVEKLTREVAKLAAGLAGQALPDAPVLPNLLEVDFEDSVWIVRSKTTREILDSADTKGEAVRLGRERARAMAPAELRILKLDGTVQDVNHYEAVV